MILRVIATPAAKRQIRAARDWWRKNRSAAPFLFEEELANARHALGDGPDIGTPVLDAEVAGLRRFLLHRTRYHIYYAVDPRRQTLFILAVWSAVRGRGPRLTMP